MPPAEKPEQAPGAKQKQQQKRIAMQKQTTLASAVYILMITLIPALLSSQVVVGGDIPDPSAALDIRSTEKGVLLPRLTTAERDAVSSPATGLTIFNTSSNCCCGSSTITKVCIRT